MINSSAGVGEPRQKSVRSRVPKKASSETVACSTQFAGTPIMGTVLVHAGQSTNALSPPAVPRTRCVTWLPDHFSRGTGLWQVGVLEQECTGVMVWVVLISLMSSTLLASTQSQRPSPDKQERVVMGRPEESRLRVGGAVEVGGASGDGMVHVGGGIIISPAEVGWGGRDATPAEVGDGVDVGEVEAEEITQ